MSKWQRKNAVDAIQLTQDTRLAFKDTTEHSIFAEKGSWLVIEDGVQFILSDKSFRERFQEDSKIESLFDSVFGKGWGA